MVTVLATGVCVVVNENAGVITFVAQTFKVAVVFLVQANTL